MEIGIKTFNYKKSRYIKNFSFVQITILNVVVKTGKKNY